MVIMVSFFIWAQGRYVVPIITYHNVSPEYPEGALNNVRPESFDRQMKFLKDNQYNVIAFDEYVQGIKSGKVFSRNSVIIHFDDGFEDNYLHAFPILKSYQFPASIFLISDSVGLDHFLKWDQIKVMDKEGIDFGAHTRRHVYLPQASIDVAVDEIRGSKRIIEEHLGHAVKYLVYPSGGFNDGVKKIVIEAGYQAASTTNRGRDPLNKDLFELNRIRIKNADNSFTMWAKLSGYYNLFRKSRCADNCGKDNYVVSIK